MRPNRCTSWCAIATICLAASTAALAGADVDKSKPLPDERTLASLRDYMEASDAEWQTLLPHIVKVQTLSRELREVRDGTRAFALWKSPKPWKESKEGKDGKNGKEPKSEKGEKGEKGSKGDVTSEVDQPQSPPPSAAFERASEQLQELRAMLQDKSARAADIRAKLDAFRVARADAEKQLTADLAKAKSELTELLTARQELACVVAGLLE